MCNEAREGQQTELEPGFSEATPPQDWSNPNDYQADWNRYDDGGDHVPQLMERSTDCRAQGKPKKRIAPQIKDHDHKFVDNRQAYDGAKHPPACRQPSRAGHEAADERQPVDGEHPSRRIRVLLPTGAFLNDGVDGKGFVGEGPCRREECDQRSKKSGSTCPTLSNCNGV